MNTDSTLHADSEPFTLPEARVTPEQLRAAQRVLERQMQVMRSQMARAAATGERQSGSDSERPSGR